MSGSTTEICLDIKEKIESSDTQQTNVREEKRENEKKREREKK
jgi:hypothetical protein